MLGSRVGKVELTRWRAGLPHMRLLFEIANRSRRSMYVQCCFYLYVPWPRSWSRLLYLIYFYYLFNFGVIIFILFISWFCSIINIFFKTGRNPLWNTSSLPPRVTLCGRDEVDIPARITPSFYSIYLFVVLHQSEYCNIHLSFHFGFSDWASCRDYI